MPEITSLITIIIIPLLSGHAYLDPGSGSFILQILIAAFVGGLFLLKVYWKKISGFFRNLFSKGQDNREE
jgi:hypothetical protein